MPSSRLLALGVCIALGVRPVVSAAQSTAGLKGPAAVADSFFQATRDARWLDAAGFMDLGAVSAMRDEQVRASRSPRTVPTLTADFFLQHDPKMPREVAEYQARQHNEQVAAFDPLDLDYARVPTIDSLARLSSKEVAARWLEARDERWGLRRSMGEYQQRGCITADSVDALIRAFRPAPARIIGSVIDDSLAYVLHERSFLENEPERALPPARRRGEPAMAPVIAPMVTTLRRIGRAWRIVPSYESGGSAFVSEMECTPGRARNDE